MSNSNSLYKSKACRPKRRRAWTPARRAAQALRIQKQKPWLKATGPKTKAGKIKSSRNAYKHGLRSAAYGLQLSIFRQLLRLQAKRLKIYMKPLCHFEAPSFNFKPEQGMDGLTSQKMLPNDRAFTRVT